MTEIEYKSLFEGLAEKHKSLLHTESDKAFFYIESVDELTEFDQALSAMKKNACMLIVASSGKFGDVQSENHFDEQDGEIYILLRKRDKIKIIDLYTDAKAILKDVIVRTKSDLKANKKIRFNISNIQYDKVGPMNDGWYGYVAELTFICPFGYSIDSGTWTDK